MVLKKKLTINPEFFKLKKTDEEKKPKTKKKILPNKSFKSNNLKKQLLEKIKNHQIQKKINNDNKIEIKENNENQDVDENEFKSSLEYLENEYKKHKKNKSLKKRKLLGGNVQLSISNKSNTPVYTGNMDDTNIIDFTDKHNNSLSNKIIVDNNVTDNKDNITQHTIIQPTVTKPIITQPTVTQPTVTKPTITQSTITKPITQHINNNFTQKKEPPKIVLSEEPKWGNLKGGNKQTYSQYKKTIKHTKDTKDTNPKIRIESNPLSYLREKFSNRQKKLQSLKNKFNNNTNSNNNIKTQIKKLSKRTFKLGKHKEGGKVSILIKSGNTRKNIEKDIKQLSEHNINNMKKTLRKKNLLKFGSTAPDNLIKIMYETAILTGDISNNNNEIFMHNYLNDENNNS